MKKAINISGILCLIIALFPGCSKNTTDSKDVEDVLNNDYVKGVVVFSAILEQSTATKTILQNDGKIYWSPEDSINVFGKNKYKFISTLKEEAPNTEFITEDKFDEADGQSFVAVYPYNRFNSYDGDVVTLSVPSFQIASSSTFDKNAFVMLAKSDEHILSFRNLCGGIKVSITTDGINRIVFKGNNGEALAGKAKVTFDESGYPVVSEIVEKESSVELIAPKDSTFKVGEWYYISCLPVDLSQGYTVEFYKEYSNLVIEASLVSDKTVAVKRSVWGRIKDADEDSHYTITPNDNTILYTTSDGSLVSFDYTSYYRSFIISNVLKHYKDEESGYNVIVLRHTNTLPDLFMFTNVTSVFLPSNITKINALAFMDCRSLTSIDIPSGVTTIGNGAFMDCRSLTSIDIPSGVTTIGGSAFSGCSSLTSVNIPSGVTTIGYCAFYGCSSLTSIDIPSGVTTIGNSAFYGCSSLTSIDIPSGVTTIGNSAFRDCRSLTSVNIPSALESIGDDAFSGCENIVELSCGQYMVSRGSKNIKAIFSSSYDKIQHIHLHEDVKFICESAFRDCSCLTDIIIPEGVTSIGEMAFSGCSSLQSVLLPERLRKINKMTFSGCDSLTDIIIPEGVTSIGEMAFSGCSKLSDITIPGSVTSLEKEAFKNCTSLINITCGQFVVSQPLYLVFPSSYDKIKSIQLLSDVTSIGEKAFLYCNSLTNMVIPDSVTSIGSRAFQNLSGITSITLPNNAVSIGLRAFENCIGLTDICIPDNASVLDEAFKGCTGLKNVLIRTVNSISTTAFTGCRGLTNITLGRIVESQTLSSIIPENYHRIKSIQLLSDVTSIGKMAFSGCYDVTNMEIPGSVTSIGSYAFSDCSRLTDILISEGVTSIGQNAFARCSSLTSITIPEGVTSIGEMAFSGCSSLQSVSIPSSVTYTGGDVFKECYKLTTLCVICGQMLASKGFPRVFSFYDRITDVQFLGDVTYIEAEAFLGCSSLRKVTLPEGVKAIWNYAFSDCVNLTDITIPSSLGYLGINVFKNCNNLTNITCGQFVMSKSLSAVFPSSYDKIKSIQLLSDVTSIGEKAFWCFRSLLEITIPDSVETIDKEAFYNCRSLRSVLLPDSITSIGSSAFSGCSSLTSITIPEGVTSIGSSAFWGCSRLQSVFVNPITPPNGGSNMFSNNASDRRIYVPSASLSSYKEAEFWNDYESSIYPM